MVPSVVERWPAADRSHHDGHGIAARIGELYSAAAAGCRFVEPPDRPSTRSSAHFDLSATRRILGDEALRRHRPSQLRFGRARFPPCDLRRSRIACSGRYETTDTQKGPRRFVVVGPATARTRTRRPRPTGNDDRANRAMRSSGRHWRLRHRWSPRSGRCRGPGRGSAGRESSSAASYSHPRRQLRRIWSVTEGIQLLDRRPREGSGTDRLISLRLDVSSRPPRRARRSGQRRRSGWSRPSTEGVETTNAAPRFPAAVATDW